MSATKTAATARLMEGMVAELEDWAPKGQAEFAVALTIAERLDRWGKQLREAAWSRLMGAGKIPGWHLVPGRVTRSMPDAVAAWRTSGWSPEMFLGCCSPKVGDVEKALAVALQVGQRSPEARDAFDRLFGDLVRETAGDPRLARALDVLA